ncbi:hypothetical protein Syun_001840 [Stephania yunnanensis]|uniref:Uncharacterized protein n=1 Tax=Stephania yunnanensis TaxID=152371 RepID=A0AAP0LFH4_9MAGN
MEARLDRMEARLDQIQEELKKISAIEVSIRELRYEVRSMFRGSNQRLDELLHITGSNQHAHRSNKSKIQI